MHLRTILVIILLGVLLSIAIASLLTTAPPGPTITAANIGFFQFNQFKELNPMYLKNAPVRQALTWDIFEPTPGKFVFDDSNKQAAKFDEFIKAGYTLAPTIRAQGWAVKLPNENCSSAPRDIDTTKPLRDGESYSETYYRFLKAVAERYKGKMPIVHIENEISNPEGDWCSSVDEYFRLVLTAKKAFRDVDPSVKIADGGLQPRPVTWAIIDDHLQKGNVESALRLYALLEKRNLTHQQLLKERDNAFSDPRVPRVKEFLATGLYQWVDIGNVHYLHDYAALPEFMAFLRANAPAGRPFMSNAYGTALRYNESGNTAAEQIITRATRLLALKVNPIMLMTAADGERTATSLVDDHDLIRHDNVAAFEATARFLGDVDPSSVIDTSTSELWSYTFRSPRGTVTVTWPKDKQTTQTITVDSGCTIFDYQNKELTNTDSIASASAPLFVVCGQ